MTGFLAMSSELFFRIRLYFQGVRFREKPAGDEPLVRSILVRIEDKYDILFNCYRKRCAERKIQRGIIELTEYTSYFVKAEFSETAPEELRFLKDNTLFFNGARNRFGVDEEIALNVIVDVFLDILAIRLRGGFPEEDIKKEIVNETFSI